MEDAKIIAGQSSPTLKRQMGSTEGAGARESSNTSDSNQKSTLSFMKGVLPKYFSSEWSFAQFRIPETRTICAFGSEPNTLIVIGADGSFHKVQFAKRSGM